MSRKSSRLSFYVVSHPTNETLDEFRYKNSQPLRGSKLRLRETQLRGKIFSANRVNGR